MGSGSPPQTLSRLLLTRGVILTVAGGLCWIGADRIAASVVARMRPSLEQQLSKPLGHPLRIGPYKGLSLSGVSLGPSEVQRGLLDDSTASVEAVSVGLAPLASLRRWKPVAVVKLRGVRVDLRRNAEGAYWVPGPAGDQPPPKLGLLIRLLDPAQIRIQPADLTVRAAGRADVHLDQSWADSAVQLTLPQQGKVAMRLKGRWRDPQFDLQARIDKLRLQSLQGLIPPASEVALQGQLGGDLQLGWQAGKASCHGGISLVGFAMNSPALQAPLRSPQLQISCKGDRLTLPRSPWSFGAYQASLQGDVALNRSFNLHLNLQEPGRDRQLRADLKGPWHQPRLRIDGRWSPPTSVALKGPLKLDLELSGDWSDQEAITASLDRLDLHGPGLKLRAAGGLYPRMAVASQQLEMAGSAWSQLSLVPELLGDNTPVRGVVRLRGETTKPQFSLTLGQRANPLLQDWSLKADWDVAKGLVRLDRFTSPDLQAQAVLPLRLTGRRLQLGPLKAGIQLKDFPLARIGPIVGTSMAGRLSAFGELSGPLNALRPDLDLQLVTPEAGLLRLSEVWQGRFEGRPGGGGRLSMTAADAVIGGSLQARLGRNWLPTTVTLVRQGGELSLAGTPASYRWQARRLPLDGLELALPPKGRFEGLYGRLSGEGTLGLQPLAMEGHLTFDRPGLLGVQLRQAQLQGTYSNRRYQLTGELLPPDSGQVLLKAEGRLGAGLDAEVDALGLSARWLTRGVLSLTNLTDDLPAVEGRAEDLGTLLVNTFGGSLNGQLQALNAVQQDLSAHEQTVRNRSAFHPEDLRGQVDARISLSGDHLADLNLELKASGHLWVEGDDVDHALQIEPFVATISGPIGAGEGQFSLQHLPFSLLALVAPVPPALLGAVGLSGRYRLGDGAPQLTTELVLEDARIGAHRLTLDKGQITLAGNALLLDLALRDESAEQAVVVTGQVPLEPSSALDVRVVTRGDGLRFLTGFTNDRLVWTTGDARLRLILSGTLSQPQANGFLVVDKGGFQLEKQDISDFNTSVVFDFNRLEVQSLKARVGKNGRLEGKGGLGLFTALPEPQPLVLSLSKTRLNLPIADVEVTADLNVNGALVRPRIGGALAISNGTIRPSPSLFARKRSQRGDGGQESANQPVAFNTLLEDQWDFQKPLVLLGPEVEASSSRSLKAAMPKLPALGFNNLRVSFGPKLAVTVAPVAAFTTRGRLTLNGALDPSLKLQGVVQMLTGRISFFTTSFQLDRRAANVAIFTPSMGLIPYVDVALTSRVSDSVSIGTGNNAVSTNIFETNGSGSLGAGGELRLVKVMVEASGPADRLADNFTLRSSPPMPRAQLLGLIGGNSLAGLSGAGGGTALAALLGQSLLTPVIGTLTDAFSQRLQFALYPTYVTPQIQDEKERVSGQVPPQLALVTELGVDLTDRFNLSVLAAPNRNDIPPQGTLSYQINPNLSLSGSVDNQGTWQSQFQVFFRF